MPRCPSRGNTPLICPRHVGRQEPEPAGKHANLVEKNESATHLPMDLGCRLKATNAGLDVASAAVAAAFCRALCADRRLVRLIPETPCGVLGIYAQSFAPGKILPIGPPTLTAPLLVPIVHRLFPLIAILPVLVVHRTT